MVPIKRFQRNTEIIFFHLKLQNQTLFRNDSKNPKNERMGSNTVILHHLYEKKNFKTGRTLKGVFEEVG